jgi:hypothetical protein
VANSCQRFVRRMISNDSYFFSTAGVDVHRDTDRHGSRSWGEVYGREVIRLDYDGNCSRRGSLFVAHHGNSNWAQRILRNSTNDPMCFCRSLNGIAPAKGHRRFYEFSDIQFVIDGISQRRECRIQQFGEFDRGAKHTNRREQWGHSYTVTLATSASALSAGASGSPDRCGSGPEYRDSE